MFCSKLASLLRGFELAILTAMKVNVDAVVSYGVVKPARSTPTKKPTKTPASACKVTKSGSRHRDAAKQSQIDLYNEFTALLLQDL